VPVGESLTREESMVKAVKKRETGEGASPASLFLTKLFMLKFSLVEETKLIRLLLRKKGCLP